MNMIISLAIFMLVNIVISTVMMLIIPNYIIATMATSVILSFLYSVFAVVPFDRLHFYKYQNFWKFFFGLSIAFLLFDCISFII